MKRYFITGTDTDCGKTHVTCHFIEDYKRQDQRVLGIKPVASGCFEEGGQLFSDDVTRLQAHNPQPHQSICHWLFKPPISPHLAANEVNQVITADAILDFCDTFTDLDTLLIEGAGGLMAPLNDSETWLDFLIHSQIPAVVVVGMRLGCLNHALLTESVLKAHQIPCLGWVANCLDKDMLSLTENIETLSNKLSWPLLATIPYSNS